MLYNEYRPRTLEDFVGQEHLIQSIFGGFQRGRVSHAYLLAGPRGTGKTTVARLMAAYLNCSSNGKKPCGKCSNCQAIADGMFSDVIELDMASNRGIDSIRNLRDRVEFRPISGQFKIFILDEVHMVTNEGANALLKTLEEPPPHIIFILLTTEAEKVLPTILSRCQICRFRLLGMDQIFNRLKVIVLEKNLNVSDSVLSLVVEDSRGSLRDAISLLDLVSSAGIENVEGYCSILGRLMPGEMFHLIELILQKNVRDAYLYIDHLLESGRSIEQLINLILQWFQDMLKEGIGISTGNAAGAGQARILPRESLLQMSKVFNKSLFEARDLRLSLEMAIMDCMDLFPQVGDF